MRGAIAPLHKSFPPLLSNERGIKGVRLLNYQYQGKGVRGIG